MQLQTSGLLIIQDRKSLLAYSKNKNCFYLPGEKVDPGETASSALCREIGEELNISLLPEDLEYYTHIIAPAFGKDEGIIMEQECFLLHKKVFPKAASEISDLRYFTLASYLKEKIRAVGTVLVLEKLKTDNYID